MKSTAYQAIHHLGYCLVFLVITLATTVSVSEILIQASPYLRAHANDAIQWQPFSKAAFAKAKQQDKPILLSSGYLSCYWCHRMAEDSFRKRNVGKLVNEEFIPILLDRELEPEVDTYLQEFITQQRGFGGWPLTVILTPNAKPIAGVSYQAEEDFIQTLQRFKSHWSKQRLAVEKSADNKHQRVNSAITSISSIQKLKTGDALNHFLKQADQLLDPVFGGFGANEKFPYAPQLALAIYLNTKDSNSNLGDFVDLSLQGLIGGGLRDHVGGGFFRYSDTQDWSTPHFEQMLYTQALLASVLMDAGAGQQKPAYFQAASEVLLGMINHFQRKDGLFHAGISAVDENGMSGGYYLWTEKQLKEALGSNINAIYPLALGEQDKRLPLIRVNGKRRLQVRQQLLEKRQKRQPNTDDKILLGWNSLALAALTQGRKLSPSIHQSAEQLQAQLKPLLSQKTIPRLIDQPQAAEAQLTDKVYLAYGLHTWAQATKDLKLRHQLAAFLLQIYQQYYQNGLWIAARDKPLIDDLRTSALIDTQLPSATGLWLQMSSEILNDLYKHEQTDTVRKSLESALKVVIENLPESLADSAFFHSTTIKALLNDALLKHNRSQGLE